MKEYIKLGHKIEVYLPSQDKHGTILDDDRRNAMRDRAATTLSTLFGGCTGSNAVGYYKSETLGTVQTENILVLFSFAERLDAWYVEQLDRLAHDIKSELAQESVMVTIDGTAIFM